MMPRGNARKRLVFNDIKRIGFSLIRVHRFQKNTENVSSDNVLLSQLKWPIETMFVGLRPQANVATSNTNQYRDWHRLCLLTDNQIEINAKSVHKMSHEANSAWNAAAAANFYPTKTSENQWTVERWTYAKETETIDTLQLTAHGINIFNTFKAAFFRDYMSYQFGGTNIITPEDKGALMLNFCLYPGTYQPSGHINVSRAREFYLQFVSSYCASATPCDLLVLAIAINFNCSTDSSPVDKGSLIGSCIRFISSDKQYNYLVNYKLNDDVYNLQNHPIAGTSLEQLLPPKYRNVLGTRVNNPGYGKNVIDWTIRSETLNVGLNNQRMGYVQRPNGDWYCSKIQCLSYGPSTQRCVIYCRELVILEIYLNRRKRLLISDGSAVLLIIWGLIGNCLLNLTRQTVSLPSVCIL